MISSASFITFRKRKDLFIALLFLHALILQVRALDYFIYYANYFNSSFSNDDFIVVRIKLSFSDQNLQLLVIRDYVYDELRKIKKVRSLQTFKQISS